MNDYGGTHTVSFGIADLNPRFNQNTGQLTIDIPIAGGVILDQEALEKLKGILGARGVDNLQDEIADLVTKKIVTVFLADRLN